MTRRNALTIGNFDGVHKGHAELVRRAKAFARARGGRAVALVFDPHPMTLLKPGSEPGRLTTFDRRSELLRSVGADEVIRLEPSGELLGLSAEQFIDSIASRHDAGRFVEGADFHFGRGRGGNVRVLADLGVNRGFDVEVVDPVEVALSDQLLSRASSSLVRWLLSHGRISDAERVLGRPYELTGVVVRGDRRGRTIGYPTANLRTTCVLPMDGVYAATALLEDGRVFDAAVNVGNRPTFEGVERRAEAFLCLGDEDREGHAIAGLPEYGWPLTLRLHAFVRDDLKFASVASLIEQIERDVVRVKELLGGAPSHRSWEGLVAST